MTMNIFNLEGKRLSAEIFRGRNRISERSSLVVPIRLPFLEQALVVK